MDKIKASAIQFLYKEVYGANIKATCIFQEDKVLANGSISNKMYGTLASGRIMNSMARVFILSKTGM